MQARINGTTTDAARAARAMAEAMDAGRDPGPACEMTQAVMVRRSDTGTYQITGEVEDWAEVQAAVDAVEPEEALLGWAPYTRAYRVQAVGAWMWYFVE